MKIFLLILLGLIVWFISAILSSLIARKFFMARNEKFWAIICTLFAPATFVTMMVILPFYFLYIVICEILGRL